MSLEPQRHDAESPRHLPVCHFFVDLLQRGRPVLVLEIEIDQQRGRRPRTPGGSRAQHLSAHSAGNTLDVAFPITSIANALTRSLMSADNGASVAALGAFPLLLYTKQGAQPIMVGRGDGGLSSTRKLSGWSCCRSGRHGESRMTNHDFGSMRTARTPVW